MTNSPALSVCLDTLFTNDTFVNRVDRCAELGVDGVEFWEPADRSLPAIRDRTVANNLAFVGMVGCTTSLTNPNVQDQAISELRSNLETAATVDCENLIVTSGPECESHGWQTQYDNIVDTLQTVAPDAEEAGVSLILEPLNTTVDHPGAFLSRSETGFDIIDEIESPNVRLLYDVYHQQITEGNIIDTMRQNLNRIGHVHIADVPGRNEPGTGELNYQRIIESLVDAGYDSYVGCEFRATGSDISAVNSALEMLDN
ncbi:hydroxypyruvate isomerase family protein [Halorubrum aethiopicum]|uniref:hydroxypyruvate isomerase family protein n=1 Tax=Halorubrum aethiopicum TaxID=1758255 RepID=UPI0009B5AF22|nr:TIM barrel protein [Halorubrum aethiopicum]